MSSPRLVFGQCIFSCGTFLTLLQFRPTLYSAFQAAVCATLRHPCIYVIFVGCIFTPKKNVPMDKQKEFAD